MAAIAMREKVVSIGHFSPSFCLQSLQIFRKMLVFKEQICFLTLIDVSSNAKVCLENNLFENCWCNMQPCLLGWLFQPYFHCVLCSLTCFLVFACSHQNIYLSIPFKIRKKRQLIELECSKTPSQMSSYAHNHVFFVFACLNKHTLLYWSYIKS